MISMMCTGGLSTDSLGRTPRKITVEAGQMFCVGDYVTVFRKTPDSSLGTASMLKASYSSGDTGIAEVDKKGMVSAKAPGKTDLYQKLEQAAEEIMKAMPSKVTEKNADKLLKKRKDYVELCRTLSVSENGFSGSNLVVPKASCFLKFCMMLDMYANKNHPKLTKAVVSVKANTKQITLNLKKPITKKQIQALRILDFSSPDWGQKSLATGNSDKASFLCTISQQRGTKYFSINAVGCAKKGGKIITVVGREYNAKKGKVVNAKLKKSKTYYTVDIYDGKIKFKVK